MHLRCAVLVAGLRLGAAVGVCPGGSVACHLPATGCCEPVRCNQNITNTTTQACADQADLPAERAAPQGAGNTCTCYTSSVQGESYKCVGSHCIRQMLGCDAEITSPHQYCGLAAWPTGGVCQCQSGYSCVAQPDGERKCTSQTCDFTIYACETYESPTPTEAGCRCTACSAGYVLSDARASCLRSRQCDETADAAGQCGVGATLADGYCRCDSAMYCSKQAGACVARSLAKCSEHMDIATQFCPQDAPFDAASGMCRCMTGDVCVNGTCGKEVLPCDAAVSGIHQVCEAPATIVGGMCMCPSWETCRDGTCVLTTCSGDAIENCRDYVSDEPGGTGCICRRCHGTGMGVALKQNGRVCSLQVACGMNPRPGTTDECGENSAPVSGTCVCQDGLGCHQGACVHQDSGNLRTVSPTVQRIEVVDCNKQISAAGLGGQVRYECVEHAHKNADGICECSAQNLCRQGVCKRLAVACGNVVADPYAFCRDVDAYRHPTTGVCTCANDRLCYAGECAVNPRGDKTTSSTDRKFGQLSLTFVGARRSNFVDSSGREYPTLAVLVNELKSLLVSMDPEFLNRRACRSLNPPGGSAPMTQEEIQEFVASRGACMEVTRLCSIKYHQGAAEALVDAEFHPDRRDCVDCNCWYPPVGYTGSPYSVATRSEPVASDARRQAKPSATTSSSSPGTGTTTPAASTAPPLSAADLTADALSQQGTAVVSLGTASAQALGAFRLDISIGGDSFYAARGVFDTQTWQRIDDSLKKIEARLCGERALGIGQCQGMTLNDTGTGHSLRVVAASTLPVAPFDDTTSYSQYRTAHDRSREILPLPPIEHQSGAGFADAASVSFHSLATIILLVTAMLCVV